MNILDQIDAATGCQHCEGSLGDSPSSDFCSPRCQWRWHAARVEPLVHYKEPTDLAAHVRNQVELRSPDTTPSPAGVMVMHVRPDLSAFQRRMIEAIHAGRPAHLVRAFSGGSVQPPRIDDDDSVQVVTSPGRVMLGFDGSRSGAAIVAAWQDEHIHFVASISDAMHAMGAAVQRAGQELGQLLLPYLRTTQAGRPEPADVMQRALERRRTRNTGPAQNRRAPRRIDPGRSR